MIRKFSIVLASLIALTGCGAPAAPAAAPAEPAPLPAPPTSEPTSAPASAEATAAFPVTLKHKYGSTEIKAEPKRIVTVGLVEQDALLALGIQPVGTTEWFGKHPGAIWPWAKDKLTGEIPTVVGDPSAVNFEKIAALKPDLILAIYSGVTAEQYAKLAQVAPTVAQPAANVDYGVPWQELTITVGQAVGKEEEARQRVADVEAAFAAARQKYPQFAGKTAVTAMAWEGVYVYGPQDSRSRFLTSLGFKLPDGLEALTGQEFGAKLSLEKADMLDVDVIVWIDPQEANGPLGGPIYQTLPVHTEGREVMLSSVSEDALGGATSFVTVLSLPYLIDGITPRMAAAIDGDPATVVEGVVPVTAAAAAAFPIKLMHKFGEIEIPAEPKRVIALGYSEVDPILALGVKPIALREWYGDQPNGIWPWSQPALDGANPELLKMPFGELNFEQLAALKPDLIVATHSGITDKEYEKLAQIAPTLAQPADYPDFGVPWQAQTELIGRALGREAQARALVTEVEGLIAAAAKANPQLSGKTVAWASPAEEAGKFWVTGPSTPPLRFLSALGLVYPEALSELAGDNASIQLSTERLDLLDVDVLISYVATEDAKTALQANPVLQTLKVVKEGRWIIFVGGDPVYGALSYSTAPSLRYAVEQLTPRLVTAVGAP